MPPAGSTHTLTVSDNNNQWIDEGTAITDMIFTWGRDATGASVSGLPSSGINFSIDNSMKTVIVFGTPTNNVSFSVTTIGSVRTTVTGEGSININGIPSGDETHNFTTSGLNSSFYTFTNANMNSNPGSTTYDGLTLTERLKIESSTKISYATNSVSTLTLLFDPNFSGNIKLDGSAHSATDGVLTLTNIPAGNHNITKGNVANLYYIKSEFALRIEDVTPFFRICIHINVHCP